MANDPEKPEFEFLEKGIDALLGMFVDFVAALAGHAVALISALLGPREPPADGRPPAA